MIVLSVPVCYHIHMRKIEKSEIKKTCLTFAEMFKDYRAYDVMFKRNKNQKKKIYYFYRYEIYSAQNYTYVFDDFKSLASIKRPGDKDTPTKDLWRDLFFTLAFAFWTGSKARRLAREYIKFAENIAKKYYDPKTDCYIKNIGVLECARGQGRLKKMIDELCGDDPVYLETHSDVNVEIYKKLGFELCKAVEWRGTTHYAMKRYGKK